MTWERPKIANMTIADERATAVRSGVVRVAVLS